MKIFDKTRNKPSQTHRINEKKRRPAVFHGRNGEQKERSGKTTTGREKETSEEKEGRRLGERLA
jgi:hypothetical protein